jgi:serine/threonine-protein kinase
VDHRADIFSLATIAYYLLTGRHPYTGRNPRELFQQLLRDPPMPLSEAAQSLRFPAALEAAVMHGLVRDPAKRPQTTTAFASEVEAALAAAPAREGGGLLGALRAFGKRKG